MYLVSVASDTREHNQYCRLFVPFASPHWKMFSLICHRMRKHISISILPYRISMNIDNMSKFFIHQQMHESFTLKDILKFTLKMLRRVSV